MSLVDSLEVFVTHLKEVTVTRPYRGNSNTLGHHLPPSKGAYHYSKQVHAIR
jgi:hypothetical protein